MAGIKEINTETLREWLENGHPVSILDIRPISERADWYIPGSIHIYAYQNLKEHDPGALSGLHLDKTVPVVAVCGGGRSSMLAAAILQEQGYDAWSLNGGMKAWSLSWNTASVSFENFEVIQFRRTGKGCLSYAIISGTEALIVDASLELTVYENFLHQRNLTLKYVAETHIHADHISRSRLLAEKTGAILLLPVPNSVDFPFQPVANGSHFQIGKVTVTVISTPGHTMESVTYLIGNHVLLTGDTLFVNGVGRPDLKADQEETQRRARLLYQSLNRLAGLDEKLLVLPAHSGWPAPFDGKIIGKTLRDITEKLDFGHENESDFITQLLAKIPPAPGNYQTITDINNSGEPWTINPVDLEAGGNRCAVS
jgi:glyoxylase-like metal-dependent hydrolase (beta-lactamase superfamily II)/rhodanese-related sulfurtransferase